MISKRLVLQIAVVIAVVLPSTGFAQRPILRQPPNTFGAPPVFELFREQTGILPNYYQFYRPAIQLDQTLRTQNNQLQRQGGELKTLQSQQSQQSQQNQTWGAARAQGFAPTGTASSFMNTSHYYP